MTLRFVGKDPDSPNNGSPTIWVDDTDDSIIIQGWRITDYVTLTQVTAAGPVPPHETVLRLPRRTAPFLREVCGGSRIGDV